MERYLTNLSKKQKSANDTLDERGEASSSNSPRPQDLEPSTSSGIGVSVKSKAVKWSSIIWQHFTKVTATESTKSKAACKYCSTNIGTDYGNTSSMIRHLQSKHLDVYLKFDKDRKDDANKPKRVKISDSNEVKISDVLQQAKSYPNDHPRAVLLTNEIGKWMALNLHPYTLVEEVGFKSVMKIADSKYVIPSRSTFSRRIIPDLVSSVRNEIKNSLKEQKTISSISLTSDMWTSGNNESYLAITSHFVDDNFEIKSNCLGNYSFKGQHSAENICSKLEECLVEWELVTVPLYIVTDNARNIISAVNRLNKAEGLTCFAHTLQLTIKDAKSQKNSLATTVAKARTIVGHFKHSAQDTEKLKDKQKQMGLEPKKLIQDVETRWNSEYFMLNRLVELRKPLSIVMLDIEKVDSFTNQDWQIAEYYVEILEPLASITEEISGNRIPTRSMIIPVLHEIREHLETFITKHEGEAGVSFARALMQAFKTRFPLYVSNNETDVLCMMVDPRFKTVYLADQEKKLSKNILKKVVRSSVDVTTTVTSSCDATSEPSTTQEEQPKESKKWSALKKLVEGNTNVHSKITQADNEVDNYLQEPLVEPSSNPLEWWRKNAPRFPLLEKTVKKYIGIPATEVASERVFSAAGNIVSDNRERLLTKHVEELVFLQQNLKRNT